MRTKEGTVVSKSGKKSIVVKVDTYKQDPKYKKRYSVSNKFHVHDESDQCKVGDYITIYETRPLSRLKRWTTSRPAAEAEGPKKEVRRTPNNTHDSAPKQ